VLAVFHVADAAVQHQPQRLPDRRHRAGPEHRVLRRGSAARRHPLGARRPVRGLPGAEHDGLAALAAHHPAAGAAGSDPAGDQPADRADEEPLAGFADHPVGPGIPRAPDGSGDDDDPGDLPPGAAHVLRPRADHQLPHAGAGTAARPWTHARRPVMNFFDWEFAWAILPRLLDASLKTIGITLAGFCIAIVLGL